jgi:hypothetical protein
MSQLPSAAVDQVRTVHVMGAKIMEGEWSNGEKHVLIGATDHLMHPIDAQIRTENGELPKTQ